MGNSNFNESETRTVLQLVALSETGDSAHRMQWPIEALAEQAPNWRVINLDALAEERREWALEADLLVLFQAADTDLLPILKQRTALGRPSLLEYNDNFYDAHPWNPIFKAWTSPLLWQNYETFLKLATEVMTTSQGLKELFSSKTKAPIHVIPNHLPQQPESFSQLLERKKSDGRIHLGWSGSQGHIADLLRIVPVLKKILEDRPDADLWMMGHAAFPPLLHLPPERLKAQPTSSPTVYLDFWKQVHIGIAPLLDTPYNRCRSDIKAVEMAAGGCLPLVREGLCYEELRKEIQLPVFSSKEDLYEKTLRLIDDASTREKQAGALHAYVSEKRVHPKRTERRDLYQRLMSQSEPSSFKWPMGTGYHFVSGTREEKNICSRNLTQTQELWNAGQREQAVKFMTQKREKNPEFPEYYLAELRCLRHLKSAALLPLLETSIDKFPTDLRFHLFKTQIQPDHWKAMLDVVDAQKYESYKEYFLPALVDLFAEQYKSKMVSIEIGDKLLTYSPEYSRLHYVLAEGYWAAGNVEKANLHFDKVAQARKHFEINQGFLSQIDWSYLEAFRNGTS
jgi:tetratricopeptide (TPR) repeat protein